MLSHFGRLQHAGQPVTSGVRYILAGFVRCRPMAAEWRALRRVELDEVEQEEVEEGDEER